MPPAPTRKSRYESFLRPAFFALDPELAHHLALRSLRIASAVPTMLRWLADHVPHKPVRLFGLNFPNRVGLAAGFDKNAVAVPALAALGFGFVEVGTITAEPQPGNPRPRLFRYPDQQALINRLGFNNDGADAVSHRLRKAKQRRGWPTIPLGINIGKSKSASLEEAAADYRYSFKRLAPLASYIVLNVSSPNTPGLRALQETEALRELLAVVQEENASLSRPVLVKIAPDLSHADVEAVIEVCRGHHVAGIIATNTTIDHSAITAAGLRDELGGLSGEPLRRESTGMVRFIRSRTQLPIIASGGIMNAAAAMEKLEAGADLVQLYTGLIFRGPRLIREIAHL